MPKKKINAYKEMNVAMIGRRFSSGVTGSIVVVILVSSKLLVDIEVHVEASSFLLTFPDMTVEKTHEAI